MSWVQNGAWWHYVTRPWWDRRWRRGFLVGAVLGVLVGVLASWALRPRRAVLGPLMPAAAQRFLDDVMTSPYMQRPGESNVDYQLRLDDVVREQVAQGERDRAELARRRAERDAKRQRESGGPRGLVQPGK